MAHDAASAYLTTSGPIRGQVYSWTKTQDAGSMAELLECGTRSFDWRPAWKEGKLGGHHGDIFIEHEFEETVREMNDWCAKNPDELVRAGANGERCERALRSANVASR